MRHLISIAVPAALAAFGVVLFEALRTSLSVEVGGFSFLFAVLGLLGLPLFLLGAGLLGLAQATQAGWRFGRGGEATPPPARVAPARR